MGFEYGFRAYFDSTTVKNQDAIQFQNKLQIPLRKKQIQINFGIDIKTQLFKTYNTRTNTNKDFERYLYTDYFSPGYKIFSGGLSYNLKNKITFDMGIIGGKVTKIKDQTLYETRNKDILYGIKKGETKKLEYGLNIQINAAPHKITKKLAWEMSSTLFASKDQIGRLKGYTADLNNAFHFIFFKYMRLSLRTQIKYDEAVQNKIYMMNNLMLGFYLSNKL